MNNVVQWIAANKEWVFSGVGLTIIGFACWAASIALKRMRRNIPHVTVSFGVTGIPGVTTVPLVCLQITNPTERTLHLGNFLFRLNSGQTLFVPRDAATGEPQQRRRLDSGDSFTFHVSDGQLREAELPSTAYDTAYVEDQSGSRYWAKPSDIKKAVSILLESAPSETR